MWWVRVMIGLPHGPRLCTEGLWEEARALIWEDTT